MGTQGGGPAPAVWGESRPRGARGEELRQGGRGLGCSPEWAGGGDVALTRRPRRAAWSRGTWPLPAPPGRQTRGRVRGARAADGVARRGSSGMPGPGCLGGPDPGAGRPSRAAAPGILCWAIAPRKGRPTLPRSGRGPSPAPGPPLAPTPSQGPEFRGCFHLQRNFPGPLCCCAAPTNRPEPAPASRPAPGMLIRPPRAFGLGVIFPWGVTMQMKVGAPAGDWLGQQLGRVGGG